MTKRGDDAPIAGRARGAPPPGAAGPRPLPGRGVPPMFLQSLPRILIVRTGSTAVEVQRTHGDYDRWFRDALAKHDLAFDLCDATRGPIPELTSHVGVVVTGSVKSVLRPEPWMEGLAAFLRGADQIGVPVQAFRVGESVWGVQFHPEATPGILRDLILLRRPVLEEDARAHGLPAEGHVERLLDRLERYEPGPARRMLDNFVRLCLRDREPGR